MLKITGRFLVIVLIAIQITIFLFLATETILYIICPVYDFPGPKVFSGDMFLNPYKDIDCTKWKKANLHSHSRAWLGITDGRLNNEEKLWEAYDKLKYDIISISDYQLINRYVNSKMYIPCYEHGYNIMKTHQLSIGSKGVFPFDFLFGETVSNKQFVINKLKEKCDLLALDHPVLRSGYTGSDLQKLTNFDLFEVTNRFGISDSLWDVSLSSGQLTYAIGDDDAHNITNYNEVGRCLTMINTDTVIYEKIRTNLKKGMTYAVNMELNEGMNLNQICEALDKIELLNSLNMVDSTIKISFNTEAKEIRFYGQWGKLRKVDSNTSSSEYTFDSSDTYIRVAAVFPSGNKLYFNPVVRYNKLSDINSRKPKINFLKSWMQRIFLSIAFFIPIFFIKKIQKEG